MDAGVLDEPRARVFSEWTTELSFEQARAVCEALLDRAPTLTTGQLIEQIKKLAIAVDPDWAKRRYEQAIADRKVVGYRNADGSANLAGYNLPLDRVAAASGHIDALAKAVKRAGDTRPIDHIRADLFLGMTDGTYTGLDDTAIIGLLTNCPESSAPPHPTPATTKAGTKTTTAAMTTLTTVHPTTAARMAAGQATVDWMAAGRTTGPRRPTVSPPDRPAPGPPGWGGGGVALRHEVARDE